MGDFTSKFSLAEQNKERWKIENWWKWLKGVFKIKEPIGRNENACQIQIITALITDLLLKVFKKVGGFPGSLYDFVVRIQEMSFLSFQDLADGFLRRSLEQVYLVLILTNLSNHPVPTG